MATITVRADGFGDYPTYYEALENCSTGDTIRLVNDGPHIIPTSASSPTERSIRNKAGTSWENPGLIIEGVDEDGNPAIATIQADPAHSNVAAIDFKPANNTGDVSYIWIRGIKFDLSPRLHVGTASPSSVFTFGGWALKFLRITDCEFWGSSTVDPATAFNFALVLPNIGNTATSGDLNDIIFEHNVVVNMRALHSSAGSLLNWYIRHNIFITHSTAQPLPSGGISVAYTLPFDFETFPVFAVRVFQNNTLVQQHGAATSGVFISNGGQLPHTLFVHSNLYFVRQQPGTTHSTVFQQGSTKPPNPIGQLGNDLFVISPASPPNWDSATTSGYGSYQFNEDYAGGGAWDSRDLHSLSERHDLEFEDLFNDVAAPWPWKPNNYTHILPYDLRPLVGRTLAADGGVVGAIRDMFPPIVTGNQSWTIQAGHTLDVPVNDGLGAVSFDPDGNPLTWSVVSNVTHGLLTLNQTTGAYSYVPDPEYAGADQFTWCACNAQVCTNVVIGTLDQPAVFFTVLPYPEVEPGDPNPVPRQYLDVAPFFRPTLRVSTEIRLRTSRNRREHHDNFHYVRHEEWDESTQRIINLGTNTIQQVNTGGIEAAKYLLVETDQPIDVSVNADNRYWPVNKAVALSITNVTSIHVRNTSTENVAQVLLTMVD